MQAPSHRHPGMRLSQHVRACRVDRQVILLDLRRDKYIGIAGPMESSLRHCVADWPSDGGIEPVPASDARNDLIASLIDQRMIEAGPPVQRASLEAAQHALDWTPGSAYAPFAWRRMAALARNAVVAAFWVRRRSLAEIVERVTALRLRHGEAVSDVMSADLANASHPYQRMRPFVLTAHDQCLYESLTLVRYLAEQRLFPRWVIGVKTRPFGAHSWVQCGSTVLNDLPERVRQFQPILIV